MMGIKESMKLPAMKSLNISQAAGQADFYSPVESRRPSIIVPHVTKHLGNNEEMVVFYGSEEAVAEFGIDLAYSLDHESVVCSVGFSKDGKFLATGSNRIVNVYEVSTGKLLLSLQDEASSPDLDLFIRSVAFSPDTLYLACGSEDKIIRVS